MAIGYTVYNAALRCTNVSIVNWIAAHEATKELA